MIFLDTNVVSELLRPRPHPRVEAWSKAVPDDGIRIASAVGAELRAGVERLPEGRRKRELGRDLDLDLCLTSTFGGRVFPFGRAAARFHAEFAAARGRAGRPAGSAAAFIAATARAHGATLLAARNTRGFEGCGVALAGPWGGAGGGGP